MNRKYKNIIICIAAVLMMLPTAIEASADAETAQIMPAFVGAEPTREEPMLPYSPDTVASGEGGTATEGVSAYDPKYNIVSYCPNNGIDGNWREDCVGPDFSWDDQNENDIVVTIPGDEILIANPPEYYILPIDPVIEPPQEDTGNDAGPCVIGVPSPCNAPEYWWPENWDWNRWIHQPPQVTLPVEPYPISGAPETGEDVRTSPAVTSPGWAQVP
jgi:hypothetical protein